MAANFQAIGTAFVQHYYNTFDSNRSGLGPLYKENSCLSFEGESFQGAAAIVAKLTSLQFNKVQHIVKTCDVQPSGANTILILVTGDLKVDDGGNPIKFTQLFHLIPTDERNADFWCHNDVFRLNYG